MAKRAVLPEQRRTLLDKARRITLILAGAELFVVGRARRGVAGHLRSTELAKQQ
jgi:hypothetical protein